MLHPLKRSDNGKEEKMNIKKQTVSMVIIAVLAAILVIMTITPLGYIPITPVIGATLNMIPVAVGAVVVGPVGGTVLGAVFGITALLNAMGVMGAPSVLGTTLLSINVPSTIVVCIVPRVLMGFVVGILYKALYRIFPNKIVLIAIIGFLAAAINTLFFMGTLILLFTPELKNMGVWADGVNVFKFVAGFVGVNALIEMAVSCVLTTIVGGALYKVGLTNNYRK